MPSLRSRQKITNFATVFEFVKEGEMTELITILEFVRKASDYPCSTISRNLFASSGGTSYLSIYCLSISSTENLSNPLL